MRANGPGPSRSGSCQFSCALSSRIARVSRDKIGSRTQYQFAGRCQAKNAQNQLEVAAEHIFSGNRKSRDFYARGRRGESVPIRSSHCPELFSFEHESAFELDFPKVGVSMRRNLVTDRSSATAEYCGLSHEIAATLVVCPDGRSGSLGVSQSLNSGAELDPERVGFV